MMMLLLLLIVPSLLLLLLYDIQQCYFYLCLRRYDWSISQSHLIYVLRLRRTAIMKNCLHTIFILGLLG